MRIVLAADDLAAFNLTPQQFLYQLPIVTQQNIAAQILFARGEGQLASLLQRHNPNLTNFVVESTPTNAVNHQP